MSRLLEGMPRCRAGVGMASEIVRNFPNEVLQFRRRARTPVRNFYRRALHEGCCRKIFLLFSLVGVKNDEKGRASFFHRRPAHMFLRQLDDSRWIEKNVDWR